MRRSVPTSAVRRVAAGVAIGATLLGTSAVGMLAATAAVTAKPDTGYSVSINQGNVPTTAPAFGSHGCSVGEFGSKAATDDGWLFVASPSNFTSFEAVFDGGTVFYKDPAHRTSAAGTAVSFPKPKQHLAVTTPAGWKLINAYANLTAAKKGTKAFFTLSHTCAATQQPQPPTASAPTAAFTNDCETGAILVTLGNTNGTAPAHFVVTYANADHPYDVAAGATQSVSVPVDEDTTGSVQVAAQGLANTPITHTWARNCTTDTDQPPAAAPTAAITHGCAIGGFHVTLGNATGTAPADFTVGYDGADHPYAVPARTTTEFTVPVAEDHTSTLTVTAPGMTPVDDTFERDCSHTVPPEHHGINPAVVFSTACTTGITAQLSNMKLDDTTTDEVTFTITTPTGAHEQVVVIANQITKRSYDIAEGTTGAVTVEAPGLTKKSKSYTKKCTNVLGEKLTKGTKGTKATKTPAVQGEKVVQLPMTGAPSGAMVEGALLLLLAGFGLTIAGRRRYQPRHAVR
jgi:hypothetical protein